jgi:hypothetical protein
MNPQEKTLLTRFGNRVVSRWSGLLAAITMAALLTFAASAQMAGSEKGRRHRDTQKTEDQSKKKADEKAYEDALKNIPTSHEKTDPWKKMR